MNEIVNFSVQELIDKISNSQVTSVEICEAYIERINKFEKDINAWAFFDKEVLLEKAKESDEYKKFVRRILSELSKEYLSNKEIEQPAQSKYESPLVRPIYAIKNIVTSEII